MHFCLNERIYVVNIMISIGLHKSYVSSVALANGSSRSIGGGEVNTSTVLLGPCVRYPADGVTPVKF